MLVLSCEREGAILEEAITAVIPIPIGLRTAVKTRLSVARILTRDAGAAQN